MSRITIDGWLQLDTSLPLDVLDEYNPKQPELVWAAYHVSDTDAQPATKHTHKNTIKAKIQQPRVFLARMEHYNEMCMQYAKDARREAEEILKMRNKQRRKWIV